MFDSKKEMSKLLVCLPFFIISPYSTHLLGQEKRWCSWYLDECHKVYLTFFLLSISCTGFFPWTVTTKPSSAYHWQCSSGSLQLELLHWFWKKNILLERRHLVAVAIYLFISSLVLCVLTQGCLSTSLYTGPGWPEWGWWRAWCFTDTSCSILMLLSFTMKFFLQSLVVIALKICLENYTWQSY